MLDGRNVGDDAAKAAAQQQTNAATLRMAARGIMFYRLIQAVPADALPRSAPLLPLLPPPCLSSPPDPPGKNPVHVPYKYPSPNPLPGASPRPRVLVRCGWCG